MKGFWSVLTFLIRKNKQSVNLIVQWMKNFQFQSKLDSIPHHVTYWAENPGHFAWIINWSLGCQVSDLWVISDKTLPLLLKKHGTFNKKLYMIIDNTEFSNRIQYFYYVIINEIDLMFWSRITFAKIHLFIWQTSFISK